MVLITWQETRVEESCILGRVHHSSLDNPSFFANVVLEFRVDLKVAWNPGLCVHFIVSIFFLLTSCDAKCPAESDRPEVNFRLSLPPTSFETQIHCNIWTSFNGKSGRLRQAF